MTNRPLYLAIAAAGFFIVLLGSLFVVHQTQQAIVFQFGKPVAVYREPGLKLKIPFIQNVKFYEKRLLDFNAAPKELTANDDKRIIVDAFMRYRITDPLKFQQAVGGDERIMMSRLNAILESSLRQVIGTAPLSALLSDDRARIMRDIKDLVNNQAEGGAGKDGQADAKLPPRGFGIEVVDVRIMRADLPQENSEAIFKRMQTERLKEAKDIRAKGEEEALKIRSRADKERTILLAAAQQQAQTSRGEGDAEATRIAAAAYSRDGEFYHFYRTMQAYRKVLDKKDTTLILSPGSKFLRDMDGGSDR